MDRMQALGWRLAWLFGACAALSTRSGSAQPVPGTAAAAAAIGACVVRGQPVVPRDVQLWNQARDGRPIARFAGAEIPLTALDIPRDAAASRVRVRTGSGVGGFRLDGFIDAKQLPLSTLQRAPVVDGHVAIEAGQNVELLGTNGGRLRVRKTIQTPLDVSVTATVPCRALGLGSSGAPSWTIPRDARPYLLKASELALYDAPRANARVVLVPKKNPGARAVTFWSSERRPGWVRLQYHRGISIDAWAKADAVSPPGPGETLVEQAAAETRNPAAPKLLLAGNPRLRKAASEAPIRSAPRDNGPVIGAVEAEAEVYVTDLVSGWASVLPKDLNVEPHGDGRFWVEAKALGF